MIYLIAFKLLMCFSSSDYLGAKYSFYLDGELHPETIIYYLRNGDGNIFNIIQSENPNFKATDIREFDLKNNTININSFDFESRTRITRSKPFVVQRSGNDSIKLVYFDEIENQNNLCPIAILNKEDTLFKLYFDELLPNIHGIGVIYPEIKYLPSRVVQNNKAWVRIEVFNDEERINNLLSLLSDDRFQKVTLDDLERDIFGSGIKLSELMEQIKQNPELYGLKSPPVLSKAKKTE